MKLTQTNGRYSVLRWMAAKIGGKSGNERDDDNISVKVGMIQNLYPQKSVSGIERECPPQKRVKLPQ